VVGREAKFGIGGVVDATLRNGASEEGGCQGVSGDGRGRTGGATASLGTGKGDPAIGNGNAAPGS